MRLTRDSLALSMDSSLVAGGRTDGQIQLSDILIPVSCTSSKKGHGGAMLLGGLSEKGLIEACGRITQFRRKIKS
jgi:hypothetical protein